MTEKVLMNDVWLTGSQNGGCFFRLKNRSIATNGKGGMKLGRYFSPGSLISVRFL